MNRAYPFNAPFLVGFDQFERELERLAKAPGDGYPPYNIEQRGENGLRITLAVAGFSAEAIDIQLDANRLTVRGQNEERESDRVFLHRGIAGRQFQRIFMLADGLEVVGASLENGLLHIDLMRPVPESRVRRIPIATPGATPGAS